MSGWPVTQNTPDYIGNFIPDIFASKVLRNFYQSTCLTDITNTDYQGEITGQGCKVTIRRNPTLTVKDYVPNQDLDYQILTPETVELYIDKAKWFGCALDDILKKQFDKNYQDLAAQDGAVRLKQEIESEVLDYITGQVDSANAGLTAGVKSGAFNLGDSSLDHTPLQFTSSGDAALDIVTRAGGVLTEQGVPQTGRWLVLPSWAVAQLKMTSLMQANEMGDAVSVLRKGAVGIVDRFTIYENNLVASGTAEGVAYWECPFGTKEGVTFATQLTNNEVLPNPRSFGTLMRSLNVYGYQVVQPKSVGVLIIKK